MGMPRITRLALPALFLGAALLSTRSLAGPETAIEATSADLTGFYGTHAAGKGCQPRLFAVKQEGQPVHPDRTPIVLVHGIGGSPRDLQAVADRLRDSTRYQAYVLAYNPGKCPIAASAAGLADELRRLKRFSPGARAQGVTLVAHSMGGIVARRTLDDLTLSQRARDEPFGPIHLIAVDTPWHGYSGLSDRGISNVLLAPARWFVPTGIMDMRARSDLFQGDPGCAEPYIRDGLLKPILPDTARIDLVFARDANVAMNYTQGILRQLPAKLVAHYQDDVPVTGDPRLMNYWRALISAHEFGAFAAELEALGDRRQLTEAAVLASLERHYPRFPGDHSGILKEHPGQASFLDHLMADLLK